MLFIFTPIPGLQYFSSVSYPMPTGPTSAPPNSVPPCPSPLMPMPVGSAQGPSSNRSPPSMAPPGCPVAIQFLIHPACSSSPTSTAPSLFPPLPLPQQQHQAKSVRSPPSVTSGSSQASTPTQLQFLLSAYRLGIVALDFDIV